ncbi:SURF1 family protein [Cereibacter sp. SYSU M97828]|nr:SURF1 family protein [Cereibacter flavus]
MTEAGPERAPRSALTLAVLGALAALGIVLLLGLGIWQVQRLSWKNDLIHRVEARLAEPPVPVPTGPVTQAADEYRRVTLTGYFLYDDTVFSQAVTAIGGGFWVLTPMRTANGTYLVNRGFVLPEQRAAIPSPEGEVTVNGLLRITEPGGGFLRQNDPAADRWFSRDVTAIGAAKGVDLAPFFIDADRTGDLPIGGLTVVSFRNNHLSYALTWFGLALGLLAATVYVARHERRLRRG